MRIVVDTDGETQSGVLHEVHADTYFAEDTKDDLQIVLGDERVVARQDGKKYLIVFKDIQGCLGDDGLIVADGRALGFGGDERTDKERDTLVLDRFHCFGKVSGKS